MPRARVSILNERCDGLGYFYGFAPGDHRQINVRFEAGDGWVAYVGGIQVSCKHPTLEAAELSALDFIQCNPVERD